MQEFDVLVGEWRTVARLPSVDGPVGGTTSFAWLEGGGYLIQRALADHPQFPNGVMVIGPERGTGRIVQHYFDSRGVARVYDISLEDGVLRLSRDDEDFAQRFTGRLSDDGSRIEGAWEICEDGTTWRHDIDLTYERV